jgi:hypothetical protein
MSTRYLFLSDGIPEPPPLFRTDENETRYYATCDEFGRVDWYPSVTSVIRETSPTSPGLIEWIARHGRTEANRLRDEAAEYGTLLHGLIAEYMQGRVFSADHWSQHGDERTLRDVLAWDQFCRDRNVVPLAIEVQLSDRDLRVAGTADLVCEMDWNGSRVRAIVDVKSGRNAYRDHAVQVALYAEMWNRTYRTHDLDVTEWFNWSPKDWKSKPTYTLTRQTDTVEYSELELRCALWHACNRAAPRTKLRAYGSISRDGSEGYAMETIDPADEVRAKWERLTGETITKVESIGFWDGITTTQGDVI